MLEILDVNDDAMREERETHDAKGNQSNDLESLDITGLYDLGAWHE